MKNKKILCTWVFFFLKYSKFWSLPLEFDLEYKCFILEVLCYPEGNNLSHNPLSPLSFVNTYTPVAELGSLFFSVFNSSSISWSKKIMNYMFIFSSNKLCNTISIQFYLRYSFNQNCYVIFGTTGISVILWLRIKINMNMCL